MLGQKLPGRLSEPPAKRRAHPCSRSPPPSTRQGAMPEPGAHKQPHRGEAQSPAPQARPSQRPPQARPAAYPPGSWSTCTGLLPSLRAPLRPASSCSAAGKGRAPPRRRGSARLPSPPLLSARRRSRPAHLGSARLSPDAARPAAAPAAPPARRGASRTPCALPWPLPHGRFTSWALPPGREAPPLRPRSQCHAGGARWGAG